MDASPPFFSDAADLPLGDLEPFDSELWLDDDIIPLLDQPAGSNAPHGFTFSQSGSPAFDFDPAAFGLDDVDVDVFVPYSEGARPFASHATVPDLEASRPVSPSSAPIRSYVTDHTRK